jgi:hypothetical protein
MNHGTLRAEVVLGRTFWRSYWIALRRIRGDRRARALALKVTFGIGYAIAYLLYVGSLELHTMNDQPVGWTFAFYGFIFGTGLVAYFLLNRSHRKQDELLNFSLTGTGRTPQTGGGISSEVRNFLEERALILSSLVARAGSEIYLERNRLAPGFEVITRQTLNARLRQNGLWDKLEAPELDLVSAADGRWTEEQQHQIPMWCEQLRLLRWTLGIDGELMPLAHFPRVDFSLARDLLGARDPSISRKSMQQSWDLRVERDRAAEYTARVVAELKGRNMIADETGLEGWADRLREKSLGSSTDYLAGAKTIAELDEQDLRLLAAIAVSREQYADYLVDQLSTDRPISFESWASAR